MVDSDRVDAVIDDIDRRVALQLEAIRSRPSLRALERTWRALWHVVQQSGDAVVDMLQAGKLESPPRSLSVEYELLVALHDFGPEDMALLCELGRLQVPIVTSLPTAVEQVGDSEQCATSARMRLPETSSSLQPTCSSMATPCLRPLPSLRSQARALRATAGRPTSSTFPSPGRSGCPTSSAVMRNGSSAMPAWLRWCKPRRRVSSFAASTPPAPRATSVQTRTLSSTS